MVKNAVVLQLLQKLLKSSLNAIIINHQLKIRNIFQKGTLYIFIKNSKVSQL